MCLLANRSSSSAHIMVLPKIAFVLLCIPFLSPLAQRWRFAVCALWLRCKTRVSAEPAGALQTLFFAWNTVQHIWTTRSETNPWPSNTPTLKLINEMRLLTIEHSVYFLLWLDWLQGHFSCCSLFITLSNGLKMSEYKAYWLTRFPLINS